MKSTKTKSVTKKGSFTFVEVDLLDEIRSQEILDVESGPLVNIEDKRVAHFYLRQLCKNDD